MKKRELEVADNLWDSELVVVDVWSDVKESLAFEARADFVCTCAVERCMGIRLGVVEVELIELIHIAENIGNLTLKCSGLFFSESESCKIGDVFYIDVWCSHGWSEEGNGL